jgi:glycolate oxidase iron-sulfur subunit
LGFNIYRGLKLDKILKNIPFLWVLNSFVEEKIQYKEPIKIEKNGIKIIYFAGCVNTYLNKSVLNSVQMLLEKNGFELIIPKFKCCGVPLRNYGDFDGFIELAKANVDLIPEDFDYFLTDCASCGMAFKEYAEILEGEYKNKLDKLLKKSLNINEFIIKFELHKKGKKFDKTITYHDPCHLSRSLKITEEPREILKEISNFIEMEDSNLCCGAAGSYIISNPKISTEISKRKAKNIKATKAQIVATSCSGCTLGLLNGLSNIDKSVKVYQVAELLADKNNDN